MDLSTWVLFGLVALIGVNQVVVRSPPAREIPALFWGITIFDLLAGVVVAFVGLPGFERTPAVSWVVGLLLVMHVAQNLVLRNGWEQAEREEARAERDEERKQRRQDREAAELAAASGPPAPEATERSHTE